MRPPLPHVPTLGQGCAGWGQRYGYQIWENSPGSYRADGAFGQYIMVFPQKDMVIVTTAEEIDGTRVFPLVEQYLLANLTDPQKGRDAWAYEHLQKVLCQWEAPAVYEPSSSYLQALLQDKTYLLKSVDSQEQAPAPAAAGKQPAGHCRGRHPVSGELLRNGSARGDDLCH